MYNQKLPDVVEACSTCGGLGAFAEICYLNVLCLRKLGERLTLGFVTRGQLSSLAYV